MTQQPPNSPPNPPHGSSATPPRPAPAKPLLRNLGEFVGHIVQGIKNPPDGPPAETAQTPPTAAPAAVRQTVEEREIQTPDGKVILRRTVIDEVRTEVDNRPQIPNQPD